VVAKGGGSENGSKLFMLKPAEGLIGIKDKVVATVSEAGPNVCPPMIVGVGIGGNFERSAILAKKALLRPLSDRHPDPDLAALEQELMAAVNDLGIGPSGLGGRITTLGVKVLMQPCHIASLPVAINIQCHSSRHQEVVL
jgi:fumarate hydratase subunit alpha